MSQHTYELVISIVPTYSGGDITQEITINGEPKTIETLLKEKWEKIVEEVSEIIGGEVHLQFVSLTEE